MGFASFVYNHYIKKPCLVPEILNKRRFDFISMIAHTVSGSPFLLAYYSFFGSASYNANVHFYLNLFVYL